MYKLDINSVKVHPQRSHDYLVVINPKPIGYYENTKNKNPMGVF
jgi:hypothetical protein